jgi:hypothetical protein
MLTHVTGDPQPLRAAVDAAVDYVSSFAVQPPRRRGRPASSRGQRRT